MTDPLDATDTGKVFGRVFRRGHDLAARHQPPAAPPRADAVVRAAHQNVYGCHPQGLDVITAALADGAFTDSRGPSLPVSDAIVVLTARGRAARSGSAPLTRIATTR